MLHEVDYLLGVHDFFRLGALRFKTDLDGEFLSHDQDFAAPPISFLRDLEYAAQQVEDNNNTNDQEFSKWLAMLMSPGSSLGGARPKASVIDENDELWIAKFPSQFDDHDMAAWEYVVHKLAVEAGIQMAPCRIDKFRSHHHTFLTKRFDRTQKNRLHFTSAMTQLGFYDGDCEASYLELAQFLTDHGAETKNDLAQLWKRIVFNIAVSNADDHLRNHGFIYHKGGWLLSPAYDINPVTQANGLHLNITDDDNSLDYELAMEVVEFFQLSRRKALEIRDEVLQSVSRWRTVASSAGLSRGEQEQMDSAFNI